MAKRRSKSTMTPEQRKAMLLANLAKGRDKWRKMSKDEKRVARANKRAKRAARGFRALPGGF